LTGKKTGEDINKIKRHQRRERDRSSSEIRKSQEIGQREGRSKQKQAGKLLVFHKTPEKKRKRST
jgi:hypothetical protein